MHALVVVQGVVKQLQGKRKVSSSKRLLVDRSACRFCCCSSASFPVVTVFFGSDLFFLLRGRMLLLLLLLLFKTKGKEKEKEKETVATIILDAIDRG